MSDADRNPDGKSIRDLAGDGTDHTMDSPEQKKAADALLNMTPAALAAHIITERASAESDLIRTMVQCEILSPEQCSLLSEEFAGTFSGMRLIEAQRIKQRPLIQSIITRASGDTRKRIDDVLAPRLNDDGSLDSLA
ncbi:MAG: hypothetical protein KBC47_00890 [Candidatus Peribacteraceae bacterium]|nr:hypothetical protein [Candidatus Peribacteraceae bacterium]